MNVGVVEAFNHFAGVVEPLHGLEDGEGDAGAATGIVDARRVDSQSDVTERFGEQEGVDPDFPDDVPSADVKGGGRSLPRGAGVEVREFEGNVTDGGGLLGDA